jgi:HD-GYP domain-containing protein (c-di-GMP phosphodiesterase class II)
MERTIKRSLIARLLAVAVGLAVLAGAAAFYFEMGQVDDLVLSLAVEESQGMMDHVAFLSVQDPDDFESLRKQVEFHLSTEHLAQEEFVALKLFDRHQRQVISTVSPDFADVERAISGATGAFKRKGDVSYRTLFRGSQIYVQFSAPLSYASGEVAGSYEVLYRVDPAKTQAIRYRLLSTVLLVMLIVALTTVAVYPVIMALTRDMARLQQDLTAANVGMLEMLGNAVAKRDRDTNSHNYRVTIYAIRLAEAAGMGRKAIRGLIKGAFLHDVGKIGISDAILHKPAALTSQVAKTMETHVQHGVDILARYAWLTDALDVVRYHHEKFDGTGYISGLRGKVIPQSARVFAIVDVFDALTSKRPYKEAATIAEALAIMQEERGTRFDPELVDRFLQIAPELHRDVCLADDAKLMKMLTVLQSRYFDNREPVPGRLINQARTF